MISITCSVNFCQFANLVPLLPFWGQRQHALVVNLGIYLLCGDLGVAQRFACHFYGDTLIKTYSGSKGMLGYVGGEFLVKASNVLTFRAQLIFWLLVTRKMSSSFRPKLRNAAGLDKILGSYEHMAEWLEAQLAWQLHDFKRSDTGCSTFSIAAKV